MGIDEQVRAEICSRVSRARSEEQVPHALCAAILAMGVDWRKVPLEEFKRLLVRSMRYWRRRAQGGVPLLQTCCQSLASESRSYAP